MFTRMARLVAATVIALLAIVVAAAPAQAAPDGYQKYSWSPNIYRTGYGGPVKLTLAEWLSAGSPRPQVVDWIDGSQVVRYPTNRSELFLEEPASSAARHHLTPSEWAKTGGRAPSVDGEHALYGYLWNEHILIGHPTGVLEHATPQAWSDLGSPSPEKRGTFGGDLFCQNASDGAIFWSNPGAGLFDPLHLTPTQYAQAGYPSFITCVL